MNSNRENNELYKLMVEASPNALILINENREIVFINKFAENLFQYTKQELEGENIEILVPKKHRIKHPGYVENYMHTPTTRPMGAGRDLYAVKKDNTEFPAEIALNDTQIDGKTYILAVVLDITERKNTEKIIHESETRLDVFFQQSIEGFFFMMLDEPVKWDNTVDKEKALDYIFEHQRVTRINDAMLEQYRAKREDFVGLTPKDFFEHDMEHGKKVWRKFFDTGKLHIDTQEQKFDGTPMIILGDYICMYDDEGKITGHFGIQREITQERYAEIALKESEHKLKTTFEISDVGITITDEQGNIIDCNKASEKILGITKEQHLSRNYTGSEWQIIRPDGSPMPAEEFASVKALKLNKPVRNVEMGIVKQDNNVTWIIVNAAPINIDGYGVVVTYFDISARKKAEAVVKKINKKLETQNNQINQSIQYAERIQFSILPEMSDITKYLRSVSVYFKPKDVIGGDFYWFYHANNHCYIAVVDCTGHNVPGAMMSMTVNSLLNKIMTGNENQDTGDMLSRLHSDLYRFLHQDKGDEYSQDGCDISLCKISNTEKTIQFSGARQDLYLFDGTEVNVIKATPKSIGGKSLMGLPEPERCFKTENIPITKTTLVGMTTDGIIDQLDKNDKVFGYKNFKNILTSNFNNSTGQMTKNLTETIDSWKMGTEQLDDMLTVLFKIEFILNAS